MDLGLAGRRVLITGAASGIGLSTARAFAHEGALLMLLDNDEAGLAAARQELGSEVVSCAVAADLSTGPGVSTAVAAALKAGGGRLDVLVNNVGAGSVRTFDELTDGDWDRTMQLNFYSAVRCTRVALPVMRLQGSGVIVNNASDLGRQPEANPIDYSVSKAALLSLTKALARSEGPAVRVNAVAPGPVWTPFWTKPGGFADTLAAIHDLPAEQAVRHEMSLRQLPLQRLGEPEEVASVILFLASDRTSFVTGSVYGVDGGSIRGLS